MKFFCKRTYFVINQNAFEINGKKSGEYFVAFKKNKTYKYRESHQYEKSVCLYYIKSEWDDYWLPIDRKKFNKYFKNLDEMREEKIINILK